MPKVSKATATNVASVGPMENHSRALMYASIWWLEGDPDELARSYDAMLGDVPQANMRLHLCLRADDGIVIVDTCPSREVFEAFANGPFRALLERHGLPEPTRLDGFPVHAAFAGGDRLQS